MIDMLHIELRATITEYLYYVIISTMQKLCPDLAVQR